MNIEGVEEALHSLVGSLSTDNFIYDLLRAYGQPKASITRLKKGDYNLSKTSGEVLWKKKLYFRHEPDRDLHGCIDELTGSSLVAKHHPRFVIVTDFETLLAVDTTTSDTLDIPIAELAKHFDFFLPWAGLEKSTFQSENPADIKAAEKMGRLYDLILVDNPPNTQEDRHALNVFLSRLLFCFFAEDTDIFSADQFTNAVASHTADDGSDLQTYLQRLFKVLNTEERSTYPQFLKAFPYVNGGLFAEEYPVPKFNPKSRKIIIECGALDWKRINPDIFGSMIQAVMHDDLRGSMGLHYTSVVNIRKVIDPLFLDSFRDQLETAGANRKKLTSLLERIYRIRIFDPACGSGNFLIISYKELCAIEIEVFKRLHGQQTSFKFESKLRLAQFYGIEIDDFAHETAKLSLWLAEHQMNQAFKSVFGNTRPTLPLQDGGSVVCANATRVNWEDVCPKDEPCEIYVLGNPPYQGGKKQSKEQKADLALVMGGAKAFKNLDYVACWFCLASRYIEGTNHRFAFVATNSITQGVQVGLLWPRILESGQEIVFAHTAFRWGNSARKNAGVTCVVVGFADHFSGAKQIYSGGRTVLAKNITPYLADGKNVIVHKRNTALSELPDMVYGNMPLDGGFLKLDGAERAAILERSPDAEPFVRPLIGGGEFLKGEDRWCLWIGDGELKRAEKILAISERIERVRAFRQKGGDVARTLVDRPHQFRYRHEAKSSLLLVPCTSSENRAYLPCGFYDSKYITLHSAQVLYDPEVFVFAVLSSRIHMAWVRAVAGRLETRIRYSNVLCYNTFPFPEISNKRKSVLEGHVFRVLEERELHSEKTIGDLYAPDKMPDGLRHAHHEMDLAVEQCYRSQPFKDDLERLSHLFSLYEERTATRA